MILFVAFTESFPFHLQSKDEVKDWVECLKHTKSFYENCLQKQSVKNPLTNNENKDVNVDLVGIKIMAPWQQHVATMTTICGR